MKSTKTNVATKTNVSSTSTKTDAKSVEVIKSELFTKKFANVDYAKMTTKEQKRQRSKVRTELFKIIDERFVAMKTMNESFDAKKNFEDFKTFVLSNYAISLANVDMIFKGNGGRLSDFQSYITDFKTYLSAPTKKEKK